MDNILSNLKNKVLEKLYSICILAPVTQAIGWTA